MDGSFHFKGHGRQLATQQVQPWRLEGGRERGREGGRGGRSGTPSCNPAPGLRRLCGGGTGRVSHRVAGGRVLRVLRAG